MAIARPTGKGTGDRYFMTNHEGVAYYRKDKPFEFNDACQVPDDPNVWAVGGGQRRAPDTPRKSKARHR